LIADGGYMHIDYEITNISAGDLIKTRTGEVFEVVQTMGIFIEVRAMSTDDKIKELLNTLDKISKDVDPHDFGIPIHIAQEELIKATKEWLDIWIDSLHSSTST
jgi:hypothetical protein